MQRVFTESEKEGKPSKENVRGYTNHSIISPKNLWITYSIPGTKHLSDIQKERYAWFCCGFLLYYDDIVRNTAVNHSIQFEWRDDSVWIYIDPHPLPPLKIHYPNVYLQLDNLDNRKHHEVQQRLLDKDLSLGKGGKGFSEKTLSSAYGDTSDPPPPPPPPPPEM